MPGYLIQVGAQMQCPHGGQVKVLSLVPRVKLSGQPAATLSDISLVTACPSQPPPAGPGPPCQKVQWLVGARRVRVNGQPVLVQSAMGLCIPGVPPGPPQIVLTQLRVKGM